MLFVFIGLTVSVERVLDAGKHKQKNQAASYAALFFIYAFSPAYNIGNNALTYSKWSICLRYLNEQMQSKLTRAAYLVEVFPYAERSRGIAIEQFWGRGAGFFSTWKPPLHSTSFITNKHQVREPHRSQSHHMEVFRHLCRLDLCRSSLCLPLLPRNPRSHSRRASFLYVLSLVLCMLKTDE